MTNNGHFDGQGRPLMIDVSAKPLSKRCAIASGKLTCNQHAYQQIIDASAKKGDVIQVAELAGIMGAKQTSALIPLCHNLALKSVSVRISHQPVDGGGCLTVLAEALTIGDTGVEMEALTAVSIACLTLYDMLKAYDKAMRIDAIILDSKIGGKSGNYKRAEDSA